MVSLNVRPLLSALSKSKSRKPVISMLLGKQSTQGNTKQGTACANSFHLGILQGVRQSSLGVLKGLPSLFFRVTVSFR